MAEATRKIVVDLPALIDRLGGDEAFAAECAELFAHELPGLLEPIREGLLTGSAEQVHRAAHTLKGSVSNFCKDGPARTAAEMDRLARDGQLEQARPLLPVLERELGDLMTALRDLRPRSAG